MSWKFASYVLNSLNVVASSETVVLILADASAASHLSVRYSISKRSVLSDVIITERKVCNGVLLLMCRFVHGLFDAPRTD